MALPNRTLSLALCDAGVEVTLSVSLHRAHASAFAPLGGVDEVETSELCCAVAERLFPALAHRLVEAHQTALREARVVRDQRTRNSTWGASVDSSVGGRQTELRVLLEELQRVPLSQAEIAKAAGCSQPTINALLNGQQVETRESIARRIRELHASHCSARFNSQLAA